MLSIGGEVVTDRQKHRQTDRGGTCPLSSLLCGPVADMLLADNLYMSSRYLTAGPRLSDGAVCLPRTNNKFSML